MSLRPAWLSTSALVTDIPSYGSWAFRDATMCFDGLFVLMGLLWARKCESHYFVAKWLMVIFVLIMFYSYTLPWGEKLFSWSPVSGVYLPVPILGNYRGTGDWLLAGATFCICVGGYVIRRRRWLLPFLTMGLLLGIAITQVRRMYLGIVVVVSYSHRGRRSQEIRETFRSGSCSHWSAFRRDHLRRPADIGPHRSGEPRVFRRPPSKLIRR